MLHRCIELNPIVNVVINRIQVNVRTTGEFIHIQQFIWVWERERAYDNWEAFAYFEIGVNGDEDILDLSQKTKR